MLGRDMVGVLIQAGHQVSPLTRHDVDITDAQACRDAVAGSDVVVNCAAWTDVDGAENHEGEAFAVNAIGARNLAAAAHADGAVMVQISTDYVFSGAAQSPYRTDAPIAPLSAYGRTKAAGEWAVAAECPRSYIVRTAWLYGVNGPNFVETMLRLARERNTVQVVDDQRGQPTWTVDLSSGILELLNRGADFGTHHLSAAGATTWFNFAAAIFEHSGLDVTRVQPATTADFPRPASRPAYSVLDHDSVLLPEWRESLRRYLLSRREHR
jgi:dTDP-4-dehydrorhamnose reductase